MSDDFESFVLLPDATSKPDASSTTTTTTTTTTTNTNTNSSSSVVDASVDATSTTTTSTTTTSSDVVTTKFTGGDDVVAIKCSKRSGRLHGQYVEKFPNGAIFISCGYEDGKLHGTFRQYYRDGTQHIVRNYHEGKRHGICREWHPNGNLKIYCTYLNDRMIGAFQEWNETGSKICDTWVVNGECFDCVEETKDDGYHRYFIDDKGKKSGPHYQWNIGTGGVGNCDNCAYYHHDLKTDLSVILQHYGYDINDANYTFLHVVVIGSRSYPIAIYMPANSDLQVLEFLVTSWSGRNNVFVEKLKRTENNTTIWSTKNVQKLEKGEYISVKWGIVYEKDTETTKVVEEDSDTTKENDSEEEDSDTTKENDSEEEESDSEEEESDSEEEESDSEEEESDTEDSDSEEEDSDSAIVIQEKESKLKAHFNGPLNFDAIRDFASKTFGFDPKYTILVHDESTLIQNDQDLQNHCRRQFGTIHLVASETEHWSDPVRYDRWWNSWLEHKIFYYDRKVKFVDRDGIRYFSIWGNSYGNSTFWYEEQRCEEEQ